MLLLLLGRRLGYGDAGYGYLLAGYGIGGVFGAGLASRLSAARNPRYAVGAVLFTVAVPSAMLAVTPCLTVAMVFAVAMTVFFLLASRIPAPPLETTVASGAASVDPGSSPAVPALVLACAALVLGPALAWTAMRGDAAAVAVFPPPPRVPGWSGPLAGSCCITPRSPRARRLKTPTADLLTASLASIHAR